MLDPAETHTRAAEVARTLTDAALAQEYAKGADAFQPEAWTALEAEVARRRRKGSSISFVTGKARPILTTAPSLDGYQVAETLGIITAESVMGVGLIRDVLAGVRDVVGGRSESLQSSLRTARVACLKELETEAQRRGADAVIAVRLDYSEISGQGKSMLLLAASGTAVRLDKISLDT
jgi:uncharacterized protein YbjQ (UPF0145 family)